MSRTVDVAIIGAGPFALSLAAHLENAGIEFRIFGKTMDSWKTGMPPGMLLKSHAWASSLYDPTSSLTLKQFCAERRIPYDDALWPVPLQTFIDYGEAFQARFAPNVENKLLAGLQSSAEGYQATFDDEEVVSARSVVLAVGVHPFKYIPPELSHLPSEALSHSGDHGPLRRFVGKKVAVVGSGASATDFAALLHEQGTDVAVIARATELAFGALPRANRSLLRRIARRFLKPLLRPGSGIGDTWPLKICADAPWIVHALPERIRLKIAQTTLGPLGHAAFKQRVVGKVPLYLGRNIESAEFRNGKVQLHITARDGTAQTLEVDRIIAATGFKVDLRRLQFLDRLLPALRTVDNTPVLSANYESSLPGLYFIGPATLNSFGPVARFVYGAVHPARRVTRHLARTLQPASIASSAAHRAAPTGP